MPRLNGWETLSALRNFSPGLAVILAIGHDEKQIMVADHPDQPDAFLHKPFSQTELIETIQKARRRKFDRH